MQKVTILTLLNILFFTTIIFGQNETEKELVEKEAIKVLKNFMENTSICGKDPKGLCAGAIYLVSKLKNQRVSQKDISKVIGVTEVTLRSRYKEFLQHVTFNFAVN